MAEPGLRAALRAAAGAPYDAEQRAHALALLAQAPVVVGVAALGVGERRTSARTGLPVEADVDLALITLTSPSGRTALPVFTTSDLLLGWQPGARPMVRPLAEACGGALEQGFDEVVVDLGSDHQWALQPVWGIDVENRASEGDLAVTSGLDLRLTVGNWPVQRRLRRLLRAAPDVLGAARWEADQQPVLALVCTDGCPSDDLVAALRQALHGAADLLVLPEAHLALLDRSDLAPGRLA